MANRNTPAKSEQAPTTIKPPDFFGGNIGNLTVFNRALTANEVSKLSENYTGENNGKS